MSSPVIRVENVSKQYRLGEVGTGTLSHDFNRWWHKVRGKEDPYLKIGDTNDRSKNGGSDYSWALRDVSFEVKQGEVLGIIGRNGAGKSTLLKILSRVTTPTSGQIKVKGRIASLLEVGTGFHPELTGRENIYINGAILGMRKAEITKNLDEIIEFSGCERYIDTPVKRYSSGMYVRLAFAVAAHLEPEILIIDEVLAVGDAEFQKKCIGKMKDVAGKGRTVIFVSHQIPSVTRLCENVIWLSNGTFKEYGRADLICSRYLAAGATNTTVKEWLDDLRPAGNDWVRVRRIVVETEEGSLELVPIHLAVDVVIEYEVLKSGKALVPNIHVYSEDGALLFIAHDWYSGWENRPKNVGRYRTSFHIPANFFGEGRFSITLAVSTYEPPEVHVNEQEAVAFTVVESNVPGRARGEYAGFYPGLIRPNIPSSTEMKPL